MIRDLHHIPLADLKLSRLNVRRHGPKEIDSLAASIAGLGLLHPLLVRVKTCDTGAGFEIVAGQRRYLAMKKLNAEGAPETDAIACVVMEATDDAAAIEASLAENVARLPMDDMDQYEAFAALSKKGLGEPEIAAHFAISEQVVKRRLAIGALQPDIRRLYRAGEIDARTLHLLTLATREQQKAWLALAADPGQTPPPPWQLKAWLLGGAEIATSAALFDEAQYQGSIASDLFGEERYFTDPDAFWRLQNEAIAAAREALLAAGWSAVHVVAPDQRFQAWDCEKVAKSHGGAVYIDVEPDGHVTIHKGVLPRAEATLANNGASDADPNSAPDKAERPELTAPLANYVDLVRHSAVRLAVARSPKVALRLVLAHLIGGSRLWTVEAERQTPYTDAIAAWRDTLPTQTDYAVVRHDVLTQLGFDDDTLIAAGDAERTGRLFARLMELPDTDVLALLAVAMAETLAMDTALIDTVGPVLAVDIGQHWQPDNLFFDLAKDREAVSAMLTKIIGETAARAYLTDTGTKKKAIIRKALSGHGRTKAEGWLPRYMRFPQAGYTARPMTANGRPVA
jgi:ParB family transcriptional regulator, chromosome partitioning protein